MDFQRSTLPHLLTVYHEHNPPRNHLNTLFWLTVTNVGYK